MPYADNNGVHIYYETEGEGQPLVLQHGFSDCIESWRELGFVDGLMNDYKLVLIDARGHGKSDKPHGAEDYEMSHRVADVIAVLDDLGIQKSHYLGYSMGGRMGFGIAKHAAERFHSLIIGGMHPYADESSVGDLAERAEQLRANGAEHLIADWEGDADNVTPEARARLLANDTDALIASTVEYQHWPGLEEVLPAMTMPCLVYCGDADSLHTGAQECVKHMPNARFVSLPGMNHGQAFEASELMLPHIISFLKEID